MNPLDMIVDRTPAEQIIFVKKMSAELATYGYSIVRTDWLQDAYKRVPVAQRVEAMAEAVR